MIRQALSPAACRQANLSKKRSATAGNSIPWESFALKRNLRLLSFSLNEEPAALSVKALLERAVPVEAMREVKIERYSPA
jgi:hypothetical protein